MFTLLSSFTGTNAFLALTRNTPKIGDGASGCGPAKKSNCGFMVNISIQNEMSDCQLENCLQNCLEALKNASSKNTGWLSVPSLSAHLPTFRVSNCRFPFRENSQSISLRSFVAKLLLLQNMENINFLIHDRLQKH